MSKMIIVEGNSNDKDNVRVYMVKGEKGDTGDLNPEDIVDNLNSTATDKALSAKQGKILNEKKPNIYDTVANMKADTNLKDGITAQTLGYHSKNDGGKTLYKVRTKTNNDVVDEGSIVSLYDNTLIAELIEKDRVTPEMFGAYGDGVHDDYQAIQNAIDYIDGGVVELQSKTYLVSNTLVIHRGLKLTGLASYDSVNSCIKLMDNVNKPLIQTPNASGGSATHYMILENLLLNGNGLNQTQEVNLIEFFGGFIGSIIKNVFIANFFGTGLAVQNCDLQIDHLWIQNGYTLSNRYALHFNPTISSTDIVSMINMNHVYVENYRNKVNGNPRNNEDDRANGIKIYRVGSININELHMEGLKYPVTIDGPSIISINMIRTAHCGISSDNNNSLIYFEGEAPRGASFYSLYITVNSVYKYWVNKSFIDNEIPIIERDINYPYLPMYVISNSNGSPAIYIHKPYFTNEALVNKVGTPSEIKLGLKDTVGESVFKTNGNYYTEIGSSRNQENYKMFLRFISFGNSGDSILVNTPIRLSERNVASGVNKDSLYMYSNGSDNYPVYQRVTGTNAGMNRIVTTRVKSSAPNENAMYLGEMYLDSTNKKLYIATAIGSATASDDWTILN